MITWLAIIIICVILITWTRSSFSVLQLFSQLSKSNFFHDSVLCEPISFLCLNMIFCMYYTQIVFLPDALASQEFAYYF